MRLPRLSTQHRIPILITSAVLIFVGLIRIASIWLPGFKGPQRLEWMTYDWRMYLTSDLRNQVVTNLAAVFISDESIAAVNDGTLGFQYGFYWPRHLFGRLVRELAAQGAKAVALDVMFGELRPDHDPIQLSDGALLGSDAFFARQLKQAGNVLLAARQGVMPVDLLLNNAWGIGDVSAKLDADGVLRRVRPFVDYRLWHPVIQRAARLQQLDLTKAILTTKGMQFPMRQGRNLFLPLNLDTNGCFNPQRFAQKVLDELPAAVADRPVKPFITRRVWNLGLMAAAKELHLDLTGAEIQPEHRRIVLHGPADLRRTIPLDRDGWLYLDWALAPWDSRLTTSGFEKLLACDIRRQGGLTNAMDGLFKDKLVFVGSTTTGNDLTDVVSTPMDTETFGVSQHWNVANALLLNRFVQPYSDGTEWSLIVLMGLASAALSWRLRAVWASVWVAVVVLAYTGLSMVLWVQSNYWLPLVLPVGGAFLMTHVSMVTYRAIFEQQERDRIKTVFTRLVSPDVVNELLNVKRLSLGGARRKVTIYFADVRGFTELTDGSQARAESYAREHGLTGPAAERWYDEQASEILATVNLYLSTVADIVKKHHGTLDKYIGDCVMAFWGAPVVNERHAVSCVRAAMEAQAAIDRLNQQRAEVNRQREADNARRRAAGLPLLEPLPLLSLGSGINSGMVIVGLMGSDAHILNYTVFGRDVNLASRLEGVSGHDRIFISESTFAAIQRDDPALAAGCVELAPEIVKGFRHPVRIFEVPWKPLPLAPPTTA